MKKMNRIYSFLLGIILILTSFKTVDAEERAIDISKIAVEYISLALENNQYFDLPDLQGKEIFICNPIKPYNFNENGLYKENDIEYYLIKIENEFIGCITLCYEDDKVLSTAFNPNISNMLNHNYINNQAISLIASEGFLYIKTADSVVKGYNNNITNENVVETLQNLEDKSALFEEFVTVLETLDEVDSLKLPITSNSLTLENKEITASSSTILNVPFVSQGTYDLCWAAAAAALGRFHTGSLYSQYTALQLANMVGVGAYGGGTIDDSISILEGIFGLNMTSTYNAMTKSQIMANINIGRPIIAGFANENYGHMVVVCGYNELVPGAVQTYYVRDSNYSSMQMVKFINEMVMDYMSGYGKMYWKCAAYRSSVE